MPPSTSNEANQIEQISVRGAKVHNLKNIDVDLPRNKLVVITGPSGSGKSSLAFDTVFAEGQRRYVESLSTYARQFLEQLEKPDVESVTGLSPAISIDQKTVGFNPRSTVGTVTEIYDYLRVLFAKISKPIDPKTQKAMLSQTPGQIVERVMAYDEGTKLSLLAPIARQRKGEFQKELLDLRQKGFVRVQVDGEVLDLSEDIKLDKNKKHDIEVYVDRIILKKDQENTLTRITESIELGLKLGKGSLVLEVQTPSAKKPERVFQSERYISEDGLTSFETPEPRTFSFNSPIGACPTCDGLGFLNVAEESSEDEEESDEPVFETKEICSECHGDRLKKESLSFEIAGKNIKGVTDFSVLKSIEFFKTLKLDKREMLISESLLKEVKDRLSFLKEVGLGYLTLSRSAQSLSGGEAQRIRLAAQLGSALIDVTYVLDEPSIGLHPRDNHDLILMLEKLRDSGNTVIIVEHDSETMERADYIVDIGPGAGRFGGDIVARGTYQDIIGSDYSITGKYLSHKLTIEPLTPRKPTAKTPKLILDKVNGNNLKNVTAEFPLGHFICVTGVSGSGKSTLIMDTLYPILMKHVYESKVGEIKVGKVTGLEHIDKVIEINQRAIGRTPRSNPATYTGLFKFIRDLFATLPESKIRNYKSGRFSFNTAGGRCDHCEGAGMKRIEMNFMADVFVKCESCRGSRYNRETLEIKYKGKSIADVLALSITDAVLFFEHVYFIASKLKTLDEVGLGYLTLGQSATTLSGGEAQRVKLAKELSRAQTGKTVFILDEPSTGLHFDDIKKLLGLLSKLVDRGNTVIVIEHNLDIVKCADHIIDLGPEGGDAGGEIIATGTPAEIAKNKKSLTGQFLKKVL